MLTQLSPLQALAHLMHNRWALPLLAELHQTDGSKFVTLVHRLGISRDSLSRTLEALIAQGWVLRNTGHGHPLRPEYLLTPEGMLLGTPALRLLRELRARGLEEVGLRKWSLPVLLGVSQGQERFSELLRALPGVTNRALTLALKDLEEAGLLERAVGYRLTPAGLELAEEVRALALSLAGGTAGPPR